MKFWPITFTVLCLFVPDASGGQSPAAAAAAAAPQASLYARVPAPDLLQMARARAVVVFGANVRKAIPNDAGEFRRIAVQPGEKVAIAITLPVAEPGDMIDVTPVDGGVTDALPSGLTVAAANLALFSFQADTRPGLRRVWVNEGNNRYVLNFWIVDPANPQPGRNSVVAY